MKYFWYFIIGGLIGLTLSLIATEISRIVAFLTLGIVATTAYYLIKSDRHSNNSKLK
ncbi:MULTISPECIES: hypothetical protein [Lysinibacillus]|uniref:Uncharacterized protein n=1 Tax=Lysinibacillus sphaericus TaxID=1421 RepID=A0A2S5D1S9_LYSSH|nr:MULTISPECIES: hypothetical protein [Lysinibacillus]AHN24072.1 hypothetical protein T479_08310 [Lysinibacillus varians]MCS1382363.1 hypothetical protein [Lysinibacillus sphaericus]MED4542742.1 hypothetical protein [Lysinibacillus sphaericus]POZ57030.1 hypothetical protein LYSIN_01813 [Lysinibacillus sphaericus]SUV16668.1 Uncharacterised protein [Lysinibacillus sphaericus]